ncbi:MAG: phosphoserine phosphatase RsbU/P, partial [Acidimicrobiia bacterium]|nr:phosphoserine phosphatase RsbU/P [Acidimicrobiia bacterium]
GTLCVIGREPRVVAPQELVDLSELAAIVMDEMELRVAARKVVSLETELRTRAEQLARMLQESLLPTELPLVPGLELAARYRPANRHRVGGDFYDVFPVADGWGVVVGDVCGHGPEAAAMTAMARHTLRALMLSGRAAAPAAALSELNRAMADRPISERRYCTVAVGKLQLVEPGAELTIALGGHPSPVRITADGDVESIGRRSPLVGWRPDACYVEANIRLEPGDTLVMYTDGLMDGRHSAAPFDEVALRRLLRSCACGTAEATADELIAAIADDQQELRDDVAVLVIRVTR